MLAWIFAYKIISFIFNNSVRIIMIFIQSELFFYWITNANKDADIFEFIFSDIIKI